MTKGRCFNKELKGMIVFYTDAYRLEETVAYI